MATLVPGNAKNDATVTLQLKLSCHASIKYAFCVPKGTNHPFALTNAAEGYNVDTSVLVFVMKIVAHTSANFWLKSLFHVIINKFFPATLTHAISVVKKCVKRNVTEVIRANDVATLVFRVKIAK